MFLSASLGPENHLYPDQQEDIKEARLVAQRRHHYQPSLKIVGEAALPRNQ